MRIHLLILAAILVSCASEEYPRRNVRLDEHARKLDTRYFKPSESMQAGVPKKGLEQYMMNQYEGAYADRGFGNYRPQLNQNAFLGNSFSGASYFPQNFVDFEEVGVASWYGSEFQGKATANGEFYDPEAMTAAHPTLPLPSNVRVTNLRNGRAVIVRVNDRGPYSKDRIIDVSERAADELGFKDDGTTKVYIQLLRNDTDEMLKRMKIKN